MDTKIPIFYYKYKMYMESIGFEILIKNYIRRIKLSFGELFAQSLGRATGSLVRARNLIPTASDSLKKSLGLFFLFSP